MLPLRQQRQPRQPRPSSDHQQQQQQQQQQPSFALPERTPSDDGTGVFSASTGVRSSTVSSIGIEDLIEEQEAAQKAVANNNNNHMKHKRGSDSLPVAPWRRESVVDLPDCSHMAVEHTAVAAATTAEKAIPKPDAITTADARISMTTTCSSAVATTATTTTPSTADTVPRKVTRKDSRSGRQQRMTGNSGNKLLSMKNIMLRQQKQRMPPRVPSRDGTISTSSHGGHSSSHAATAGGSGFHMFSSFRNPMKNSNTKKSATATKPKKSKTKKVTSESTTKRRGRRPGKAAGPQPPQRTKSPSTLPGRDVSLDDNHEVGTSHLSTLGSTEKHTGLQEADADYILDHLSPAMAAKLDLGDSSDDDEDEVEEGDSSDSQEDESYLPNYTTTANNTPTTSPKSNSHSRKERQKSLHLNQLMSFRKGGSGSSSISTGSRKKERQKSFHLNQLMGLGSFRNLASLGSSSKPSKTSNNNIGFGHHDHDDHHNHNSHNHNSSSRFDGSFMSSISTAFSSMSASGFFLFHTSQRDRNRAEMDGESLPHLNMNSTDLNNDSALLADDDDEVEWEHDYGEPMAPPDLAQKDLATATNKSSTASDQKRLDNKTPPRLPGRQKSWQSHDSENNHGSASQLQPAKSPVRRRRSDLMPKMPWRNTGGVGHRRPQLFTSHGNIDCIAEAENEVDVSTSFHASNNNGEDVNDVFSVFPNESALDVSPLPSPCVDKMSGGNRQRKRRENSPVLPTRKEDDDTNQRQFYVATRAPDDRHPRRSDLSLSDHYSRNNSNIGKSSSHGSQECPEQEMNYPVRQESLQTLATLQSTSEHLTKAPMSVRPEATTMEKKSLLKQTLHFPKQRLGHALKRVVSVSNSTAKSEEHPTKERDNTASTIRSL